MGKSLKEAIKELRTEYSYGLGDGGDYYEDGNLVADALDNTMKAVGLIAAALNAIADTNYVYAKALLARAIEALDGKYQ